MSADQPQAMAGAALREHLHRLRLTPQAFAIIAGRPETTVQSWLASAVPAEHVPQVEIVLHHFEAWRGGTAGS